MCLWISLGPFYALVNLTDITVDYNDSIRESEELESQWGHAEQNAELIWEVLSLFPLGKRVNLLSLIGYCIHVLRFTPNTPTLMNH